MLFSSCSKISANHIIPAGPSKRVLRDPTNQSFIFNTKFHRLPNSYFFKTTPLPLTSSIKMSVVSSVILKQKSIKIHPSCSLCSILDRPKMSEKATMSEFHAKYPIQARFLSLKIRYETSNLQTLLHTVINSSQVAKTDQIKTPKNHLLGVFLDIRNHFSSQHRTEFFHDSTKVFISKSQVVKSPLRNI